MPIKKLFTLFICTLTLAMSFTSCGDEAFDVDSVNKQTILVFFPWTGSSNQSGLYSDLLNNVDSICAGIEAKKGLNNTRVLLFMSQNYQKSHLIDLKYDDSTKKVVKDTLKTYEGTDYATAEGFASILNEVKQNAEALNYALIIGAHGCGWTYASDWVNYPNLARPKDGNSNASKQKNDFSGIDFEGDANHPGTRFFGSVSLADEAIDVPTLAEGIKMSGIKMQYILFDACYMGNVETAYELKDVTNYMIASSSEIMQYGLPYKSIWTYLNSTTPNYSSIVSTSINFYKTTDTPYLNLGVTDCRQLDALASVMKNINSNHTLSSDISLESIQKLDGFAPTLFYDLGVYVDSLCPSGMLKDQFNTQLKKTIKASGSTDQAYTALFSLRGTTFDIKSYSGLTISDPSLHSVAIKGREKTGWWKATH